MNEKEAGGRGREQSAFPSQSNLMVSKESYKIRKSPPAPVQQTKPVVIYMVPPKVIHADASEFMAVVQRLTGSNHEEEDRGQSRETRGRGGGGEDLVTGVVEDYHEQNFCMSREQEDGIGGVGDDDAAGSSSFFDAFSKKY